MRVKPSWKRSPFRSFQLPLAFYIRRCRAARRRIPHKSRTAACCESDAVSLQRPGSMPPGSALSPGTPHNFVALVLATFAHQVFLSRYTQGFQGLQLLKQTLGAQLSTLVLKLFQPLLTIFGLINGYAATGISCRGKMAFTRFITRVLSC